MTDSGQSPDDTDTPEVGERVEVTFHGEVADLRGVGGHRTAVISTEGVPGGYILAYIHDTTDGEYAENYTDHKSADIRPTDSDPDRSDDPMTDGGDPEDARIPVTLRDDAHADVHPDEVCDGADGYDCVREDPTLTRGGDEIHVTEYGPGSERAGERRVLCSDCREKQNAVQIARMPDTAPMYSDEEISDLQNRFPGVLGDVELETDGDGDE